MYDSWQEALEALVRDHGLQGTELGDISRRATAAQRKHLCADCGAPMGAFKCTLCSGINEVT